MNDETMTAPTTEPSAEKQTKPTKPKRTDEEKLQECYTNGKTPPKITDVSFIGDVSRQGILPDLVKYFIETNR